MRARAAALALVVLLASARAAAEPAPQLIRTVEPRLLCKPPAPSSSCIELRPGRFLDEHSWLVVDAEHRRLQDALTRSDAENKSLRQTAKSWQPGWKTLTLTLLSGVAVGVYLTR